MTAPTTEFPQDLKQFTCQKLRHEYGHLVVARLLGFETGEVVIQVFPEDRQHKAWSEIFLGMPLRTTAEIANFLERRIVILFSGAMSEAPCAEEVGGSYVEQICFKLDGAGGDESKIREFIAVHQNITKPDQTDPVAISQGRESLYHELRDRAAQFVQNEFELIAELAADHADQLRPVSRGWSWGVMKTDVDALPRLVARFAKS